MNEEEQFKGTHPRICSSDSGMSTYSCIISYTLWLFRGAQLRVSAVYIDLHRLVISSLCVDF